MHCAAHYLGNREVSMVILKDTQAPIKPFIEALSIPGLRSHSYNPRLGLLSENISARLRHASACRNGNVKVTYSTAVDGVRTWPAIAGAVYSSSLERSCTLYKPVKTHASTTSYVSKMVSCSQVEVTTQTSDGLVTLRVSANDRWNKVLGGLRYTLLDSIGVCEDIEELSGENRAERTEYISKQINFVTAMLKVYGYSVKPVSPTIDGLRSVYRDCRACLMYKEIPVSLEQLSSQGLLSCDAPVYIPCRAPFMSFANIVNTICVTHAVLLSDIIQKTVPDSVLTTHDITVDDLRAALQELDGLRSCLDSAGNAVLLIGTMETKYVSKKSLLTKVGKLAGITAVEV